MMNPARRGQARICVQVVWLVSVFVSLLAVNPAWAHEGNPNYRSEIRALKPAVPGVELEVLNYDDRLLLTSKSDETILVRGYEGEPYVRILSDGTVQVNKRSPSFYLNEDRFAKVEVPADADERAPPLWDTVSKTGRYEWHDHRIHWMSKEKPPQVKDEDKAVKVLDWRVPLRVGDQNARLTGTLRWEPSDSSAPIAAYIAVGAVAAASGLLILASRRIRRRKSSARQGEAWG